MADQLYKFRFTVRTVRLDVPGSPVKRHKTVGGINALDAECRLRKILHKEGQRIKWVDEIEYLDSTPPAPERLKGFDEMMDLANYARQLLTNLENSLNAHPQL